VDIEASMQIFAYTPSVSVSDMGTVNNTFWPHGKYNHWAANYRANANPNLNPSPWSQP